MRSRSTAATLLGGAVPVAVAAALLPLRPVLPNACVAVVIVGAIAVAGAREGAISEVAAALAGAAAFDFLWTEPYGSLTLREPADRVSGIAVLVVGALLVRALRRRSSATSISRRRIRRRLGRDASPFVSTIGQVAHDIAEGDTPGLVVLDVARSLVEVLDLADCRFERPPFSGPPHPELRDNGELAMRGITWNPAQIGLPEHFYIPLATRGIVEGRYACTVRRRRARISADRVTIAVALAQEAGVALLLEAVS